MMASFLERGISPIISRLGNLLAKRKGDEEAWPVYHQTVPSGLQEVFQGHVSYAIRGGADTATHGLMLFSSVNFSLLLGFDRSFHFQGVSLTNSIEEFAASCFRQFPEARRTRWSLITYGCDRRYSEVSFPNMLGFDAMEDQLQAPEWQPLALEQIQRVLPSTSRAAVECAQAYTDIQLNPRGRDLVCGWA